MTRLVAILVLLVVLVGAALLWLGGGQGAGEGVGAPDGAAASSAPSGMVPPDGGTDDAGDGPDNSFIVCPGDPRCP